MTRDQISERVSSLIRAHFARTGHRQQPGEITHHVAEALLEKGSSRAMTGSSRPQEAAKSEKHNHSGKEG